MPWKKIILVSIVVIIGVYSLGAFSESGAVRFAADKSAVEPSFIEGVAAPNRLKIPKLGIIAQVQEVGITKKGEMGIPTNYKDVAWYRYGPVPGALGSAVIAGHFDGKDTPRAVFYDLEKLSIGDVVEVVDQNSKIIRFQVVAKKTYNYASSTEEVFGGDPSKSRLNLITCSGDWRPADRLYDERTVIFTEILSSEVVP